MGECLCTIHDRLLRLCEVFNENVPTKNTQTRGGCHHGYSVVHISVSHMSLIPGRPSKRDKQNPPMRLKLCNFDRLLTQIPQRMPKKKKKNRLFPNLSVGPHRREKRSSGHRAVEGNLWALYWDALSGIPPDDHQRAFNQRLPIRTRLSLHGSRVVTIWTRSTQPFEEFPAGTWWCGRFAVH